MKNVIYQKTNAQLLKILQNSFYGVLGAEGCLYARTELAGAVTSFGRKFLLAARDFFEARGYPTLYGDTDSVFVQSGLGAGAGYAALAGLADSLAETLNAELAALVGAEYGLESRLRIRRDKLYRRFFIPRLRIDPERQERGRAFLPAAGSPDEEAEEGQARGRAKGYAGLRLGPDGEEEVEVKGMEAARSDWTALARRFQLDLLALALGRGRPGLAGAAEVEAYCRAQAAALRSGALDGDLVYRKLLRRPASDYATSSPQVVAARLLGWGSKRGSVSYVMTKAGPEPRGRPSGSPLDYEHYALHQLLPIARAIVEALAGAEGPGQGGRAAWNVEAWLADRPQMELGF